MFVCMVASNLFHTGGSEPAASTTSSGIQGSSEFKAMDVAGSVTNCGLWQAGECMLLLSFFSTPAVALPG